MGNSLHPIDALLDVTHIDRRHVVRLFAADGVVCETERAALRLIDRLRGDLLAYRQRQQAAESFERNGDTRHTRQLFRDTGVKLVVVTRQEESAVVSFPDTGTPPGAA